MNQGRIIVITGAPGTGKTTTASVVAKESDLEKSVHMHTDDFYHYLSKGAIPPHLPESNEQNLIVIEAFLEAAKRYARGGVVKEKIDNEIKQLIWDKMLENEQLFPKKGFEFSVVLEDNCRNIKHPIPYELHGSRDWIERYKEDKTIVINDDYKVDPDLASHFNVINVPNDKMDFGKPSKEVFSKVPKEYIIDSNYSDTLDCVEEIVNNPVYCILNLCRFYALIRDDLTLSKYDGGKWALENMDSNYNDVIKNAMEDYLSDTNNSYDNTRLKEFAGEAISLINDCVNTNKIRK